MTAAGVSPSPMSTGVKAVDSAVEGLSAVLRALGAVVLAVLFVLVMTSVTLRYVFGSGFIWSEELAIWLNVLLVAIGRAAGSDWPASHAA